MPFTEIEYRASIQVECDDEGNAIETREALNDRCTQALVDEGLQVLRSQVEKFGEGDFAPPNSDN